MMEWQLLLKFISFSGINFTHPGFFLKTLLTSHPYLRAASYSQARVPSFWFEIVRQRTPARVQELLARTLSGLQIFTVQRFGSRQSISLGNQLPVGVV